MAYVSVFGHARAHARVYVGGLGWGPLCCAFNEIRLAWFAGLESLTDCSSTPKRGILLPGGNLVVKVLEVMPPELAC